jgi:transmembrane sensor
MNTARRIESNPQISEEAAEWLIEFRSGDIDSQGRSAFDSWLRASPEHLRAFIEMSALWHESGSVDPERKFRIEDVIARASTESTVIDFDSGAASHDSKASHVSAGQVNTTTTAIASRVGGRRAPRGFRRVAMLAAAATVVGLMVVAFVARGHLHGRAEYTTEVGEQRSFRLADGSTVILDSRSRLLLAFDDSVRAVDLLQGRALFRVAANPGKPFIVRAGGTTVRVIGTRFDVNESARATVVTVVEGRVAVYSGGGRTPATAATSEDAANLQFGRAPATGAGERGSNSGPDLNGPTVGKTSRTGSDREQLDTNKDAPTMLSAGEQLSVTAGQGSAQPVHANVSSVTAWTQGRLILESASLTEVADEFNRYSSRKLFAEDHGPVPLKLSGVFVTDPDFLIQYLRNRPDIVVSETNTEVHIVRKARE